MVRAIIDDLGVDIQYFCINANQLRSMNVSSHDTLESLHSDLEQLFSGWDIDLQIIVNPTLKEIKWIQKNVDCVISDGPMGILHGQEAVSKTVDISSMNYLLFETSFKGFVEFGQLLALYINDMHMTKQNNSIISHFNYDPKYYSLMADNCYILHPVKYGMHGNLAIFKVNPNGFGWWKFLGAWRASSGIRDAAVLSHVPIGCRWVQECLQAFPASRK
jgi:hypothetical protein